MCIDKYTLKDLAEAVETVRVRKTTFDKDRDTVTAIFNLRGKAITCIQIKKDIPYYIDLNGKEVSDFKNYKEYLMCVLNEKLELEVL